MTIRQLVERQCDCCGRLATQHAAMSRDECTPGWVSVCHTDSFDVCDSCAAHLTVAEAVKLNAVRVAERRARGLY